MLGHSKGLHTGAFWLNPSETYIDVETSGNDKMAHWFSEAGIFDIFLMAASTPADVQTSYTRLTGRQHLPPLFAISYHQCRWNYNDEADVFAVDTAFDEHDIPYDVLWLDIEHTDGKKYFTWDGRKFPNPAAMQESLASRGRNMVVIVDPHLKKDAGFPVYQDAVSQGFFVKNRDGNDFEGHCWPGGSMWLDYTQPKVQEYWASRFQLDKYIGSTKTLYTWNDMNEPSVFNGPEITMPKDNKHLDGALEHREIHNMYGYFMTHATVAGQAKLRPGQRPFLLSRSFFAGSQRDVAVWTGDNEASWESLRITQPMLLTLGMCGIQFSGADIGGFFKNPDRELLVRWYQVAAFQPFMRAHAHIETERREPWLFGDETTKLIRAAVRTRYAMLPYVYTTFYKAHTLGYPVLRPLLFEFPDDERVFAEENAFLLGNAIIVKPADRQGQSSTDIYLPGTEPWYEVESGVPRGFGQVTLSTPIEKIAALQRGGTVIAQRRRARRSSRAMRRDPFTLVFALDSQKKAKGDVYFDEGDGYDYQHGAFVYRTFSLDNNQITSVAARPSNGVSDVPAVERLILLGVDSPPKQVVTAGRQLEFQHNGATRVLTIRKPELSLGADFTIQLQ